MERVLIYLLSENELAKNLRKKFDFYIFPMINIDGVIMGNYRVNFSGKDLNRTYDDPSSVDQPTIYHYKNFITNLKTSQDVQLFLDIHCHSKKFNCFLYANPPVYGEKNVYTELFNKNCDFYSLDDTIFTITKSKETSARVVI